MSPRNYLGHGRDFSGRVVPEKIETQNPLFRSIFDCESYALANKSVRYTREQAHTLGRLKKDVTHSFGPRSEWNGEPPLLVFQFLRKFCKACDDNDVSEAEAFYMLQDFTRDPLRTEVMAIMPSRHGGNPGEVTCYLQLINWLLRLHADEETLALQVEEFSKATQQASEDERAFATRLRHLNVLCGFIHSEAMLKSRFVEGCHKAVRSTVRERNTPSLTLAELARIAQTKGDEYRWLREEQRKASALEYKRLAEASRAARPTRPAFVPRSIPRTRVGAVQDDDPEVAGVAQPSSAKLTPTGQVGRGCWQCGKEGHWVESCPSLDPRIRARLAAAAPPRSSRRPYAGSRRPDTTGAVNPEQVVDGGGESGSSSQSDEHPLIVKSDEGNE
ncbi:hypothetical protein MMPV_007539 [Pyropia vietnamensis]